MVVSALRVVVLPDPAGPTSASSRCSEVRMARMAAVWSSTSDRPTSALCCSASPSQRLLMNGKPLVSAASMRTLSAARSSVEVNSLSPTRRRSGSRVSSSCTHAAWTWSVIALVRRSRSCGEAIRRTFEARSVSLPTFQSVHTDRLVETSCITWATIAARTSGPTSCACRGRP